ncbi:MAG TPA: hypothetical protein PLO37_14800 [Candidatus Hydrogenedentes bacterium]|nr:hypothetical protein [Candidatus Hydrogenedentota bacterium]HPG68115.1 hypothetical protein [Candidatus Hydrogenedentota bacterium]
MASELIDRSSAWLSGEGPEAAVVVGSECSLLRDLADFPFLPRCSDSEKASIEERIVGVLTSVGLLDEGRFYSLASIDCEAEAQILAERRLVTYARAEDIDLPRAGPGRLLDRPEQRELSATPVTAPQGVYVADDHSMSVMINGPEHLCVRVLVSGLQLQEAWARLNMADDTLASALDFAFDERYGYLTGDLAYAGTGFRINVILHLPALAMTNAVHSLADSAKTRRQRLQGVRPMVAVRLCPRPVATNEVASDSAPVKHLVGIVSEAIYGDLSGALCAAAEDARGDLYMLSNTVTLGVSEEELVFDLRHFAAEIVKEEQQARETLLKEGALRIEDRVARAVGLARSARLLSLSEALDMLSSIRLGVATGLVSDHRIVDINRLLLDVQNGHVRMKAGGPCDEWAVSRERANMIRARFCPN